MHTLERERLETATARDASNNVVNGFAVTWNSATPAVAAPRLR